MTATLVAASGVALAATITCTGGLCLGTNAADTMTGTIRKDEIRGRAGDDTIRGRGQGDVILGQTGNDALLGQDGSDKLTGGAGNDTLNGALGDDRYLFADGWGQDRLSDTGGRDILDFSALTLPPSNGGLAIVGIEVALEESPGEERSHANEVISGANTLNFPSTVVIEDVIGGAGHDHIHGNTANNRLFGSSGNDLLNGRKGHDTLNGGPGDDTYEFHDGWGSDTITADTSGAADSLDFVNVNSSVIVILDDRPEPFPEVRSGQDTVNFSSTVVIERVFGSDSGSDYIDGNASDNFLAGRGGDDSLWGNDGDDRLFADDGNDGINGGGGNDTFFGGPGDDLIFAQDGEADTIYCGPGNDVAYYDPPPTAAGTSPDTFPDSSCETIEDGPVS